MIRIVTSNAMRAIDKFCIEKLSIPSIVLMENAALKILKNIDTCNNNCFVIICGSGNNGGDGLALARHLIVLKKNVDIFLIGKEEKLTKDCKVNYDILKNMGINIQLIDDLSKLKNIKESISKCDVIVDAIFGTGISRKIEDLYELVINNINSSNKYVLSIDIPSGLNGDNGQIFGVCVNANKTVSFECYKKGFFAKNADSVLGDVVIEKIGIPEKVYENIVINDYRVDINQIRRNIGKRDKYSHKGSFGRVSIIAGAKGFTGAAYIATQSAVRSGAGLVTLCCMDSIQQVMSNKLIEAMTVSYKEKERLNDTLNKSDVIAIGPGMGNNEATLKILSDILSISECPLVIDADAINVLENRLNLLKNKKNKVILTPHPGEMSRMIGMSIEKIESNRIEISRKFAKEYGVILLLKGYNTVITDGEKVFVNSTGNSSMSSGGMGDCLTGMIASLIGQGLTPLDATYTAAYIHGYCGEQLSKKMFCVNAQHVLENIPYAIKEIQN